MQHGSSGGMNDLRDAMSDVDEWNSGPPQADQSHRRRQQALPLGSSDDEAEIDRECTVREHDDSIQMIKLT